MKNFRRKKKIPSYSKNLAIALIVLVVAFAAGWRITRQGLSSAIEQAPQTESVVATFNANLISTPTPIIFPSPRVSRTPSLPAPLSIPTENVKGSRTSTPSRTPTATRTSTSTVTPTRTATPTSILFKRHFDNPIGGYYKFLIHKAKDGERLETFAEKYNTSVEAILGINYHLTNPVWEDVLFVVPINFTDVEKQPVFVIYEIKREERGISPDTLAKKLRVNPFDLKYYNDMLNPGERPNVGDLILVPWAKPVDKIWWYENNRWDNNKRGWQEPAPP